MNKSRGSNGPFGRGKLLMAGALVILLLSSLTAGCPALAQEPIRIIWLHHSCGQNLINQGGVRGGLSRLGYEFYDHGYNDEGLRLADGSSAGYNYDVPGDNTDPDGFATIFSQPLHSPPDNTFSHLMQYDVIAFKSCFPVSNIASQDQLNEYKAYYRTVRDRIAQHPDKIFITVTQPPQVPGASNAQEAERARALANWLRSDDYLAGLPNLFTFDFFGYLAGDDNFLRPKYRMDDYDAHPNERANREIGPHFVSFVDEAIRSYGARPAPPAATEAPQPADTAEPSQPTPTLEEAAAPLPLAGNVVDDFEGGDQGWLADHDHEGSSVACVMDSDSAHGGGTALRADYSISSGGWGGCTIPLEPLQDWSAGAGLSFWIRSDGTDQQIGLMVFAGDPMAPTPFETFFSTTAQTADEWVKLDFLWSDLDRAEWADEGGLSELDVAQIVSYGFGLGLDESHREGVLWVDDIQLLTEEPEAAAPEETEVRETAAPEEAEVQETAAPEEPQPTSVPTPSLSPEPTPAAEPTLQAAVEPTQPAEATATAEIVILAGEPPSAEGESEGGICPLAAVLPLGALALVLARRRP